MRASIQLERDSRVAKAALAVLATSDVRLRLRAMRTEPLFTTTFLSPGLPLPAVVGVYNRINSAGRRVEAEETAFARLTVACPNPEGILPEFFEATHRTTTTMIPAPKVLSSIERRDGLLQRQKESRFGFRFLMRAFAISLGYHASRSLGSASLSFDSINGSNLAKAGAELGSIRNDVIAHVAVLAEVLREDLKCDDFRMIPDATSLWPLLQLIIRFPGLSQARSTVASIAQRLLIADLKTGDLLDLANKVGWANSTKDALGHFEMGALRLPEIEKSLEEGIAQAKSLQNRFTLLLYPLLRKLGARDFDYEINLDGKTAQHLQKQYGERNPALNEHLASQRQHLVPYKLLKTVFELESSARPGDHEVNDLGNLTWISAGLNSCFTGVGSTPLNLRRESQTNRNSHLITEEVLGQFEEACKLADLTKPGFNMEEARTLYRDWCTERRKLMTVAYKSWIREIHSSAQREAIPVLVPARRLVNPQDEDLIYHSLKLSLDLAPVLSMLVGMKGMANSSKKGASLSRGFHATGKGNSPQSVRVDVFKETRRVQLKFSNEELRIWMKATYPKCTWIKDDKCDLGFDDPAVPQVIGGVWEKLMELRAIATGKKAVSSAPAGEEQG